MKTSLEIEVEVIYDYQPGQQAYVSGPPENCYPAIEPSVDITEVLHNGHDIFKNLTLEELYALEEDCLNDARERAVSAAENRADEERDRHAEDTL